MIPLAEFQELLVHVIGAFSLLGLLVVLVLILLGRK